MRQIKLGSNVQVIVDKDSGMLIGRKGVVISTNNNKFWVKFDNHSIPLPFDKNEVKAINKKRS